VVVVASAAAKVDIKARGGEMAALAELAAMVAKAVQGTLEMAVHAVVAAVEEMVRAHVARSPCSRFHMNIRCTEHQDRRPGTRR